MIFKKLYDNLDFTYISRNYGGYISKNNNLINKIPLNEINITILEKSVVGTPIFKLGRGNNKILLLSGIHGNELPSQIASLYLINYLIKMDLNATIYLIPFASPFSSMNNERNFNGYDLNRTSHIKNSLSYNIIQSIKKLGISFVGDFHSTALKSNPGREAIFSSNYPSIESFLIASYIANSTNSEVICEKYASLNYKGAIEDECNLMGIPAVTCEVLSPFGEVKNCNRSFLQMKSFLSYFGVF